MPETSTPEVTALIELKAFMDAKKTGRVVLHVLDGRIMQVETTAVKKV